MPCCELSGKGPVVKNLVSHSNRKTKTRAFPNIQRKAMFSATLNETVTLNVAASAIRDIEHSGGFDSYLLRQPEANLSKRALTVSKRIRRKLRG